jgi:glycerol-3-phosphate acyltransferase PlsY
MAFFLFLFCVAVAYVVGSVCSAVIVCRIFALPDPRLEGSKNPGATNVLRLAGKQYAIIVLITDMLKGLFPVLLAKSLGAGPTIIGFTSLAAVLGHMYPVFFGFKGGKGVATAIGALLGINLILGSLVIAIWLIIANFTRYSSLSSMVSLVLAPFLSIYTFHSANGFVPLLIIAFFVLYKHRNNINRLMDGTEPKIDFRRKTINQSSILEEPPGLITAPSEGVVIPPMEVVKATPAVKTTKTVKKSKESKKTTKSAKSAKPAQPASEKRAKTKRAKPKPKAIEP